MAFQIHALAAEPFMPLHGLDDITLKAHNAKRLIADSKPGFPCRVSLEEAEIGERVLLINYEHQPNDSPFKSRHAIFVREGAVQKFLPPDTVPENWSHRLLSLRGFNAEHDIIQAECVMGHELRSEIEHIFGNPDVKFIHIHNAKPGCYAAKVTRC